MLTIPMQINALAATKMQRKGYLDIVKLNNIQNNLFLRKEVMKATTKSQTLGRRNHQ